MRIVDSRDVLVDQNQSALANSATHVPRDITVSGNHAGSRRIFVAVDQISAGALDALSELFVTGNHVVRHEAFDPMGVIRLDTNAVAP